MIYDIEQEKDNINLILTQATKEILIPGTFIDELELARIESQYKDLLRALQVSNKVYEYALGLTYEELTKNHIMNIAYSLITTSNMKEEDKNKYESFIQFTF